jgi:hypothetical protein
MRCYVGLQSLGLLEAEILATMENHIIVIIHCVLPTRRNESADCYPFQGMQQTMKKRINPKEGYYSAHLRFQLPSQSSYDIVSFIS